MFRGDGGGGALVADPTQLPAATGQTRIAGSYGLSLAAGQTYVDPNSGTTVLKLTDTSTPNAGSHYHGYSEGGPNISQPWVGGDGNTYYTAFVADGWLVDIRYDTFAPSNWRASPTTGETRLVFSMNPATPRICFYISGAKQISRYDTATNAAANTGNFPKTFAATGTGLLWLQTQLDDVWIVGMLTNGTTVGFKHSTNTEREIAASGHDVDEPHLDREYPIVYISTNDIDNWVVDLETGSTVTESGSYADFADHACPLRGEAVALSWDPPNGDSPGVLKITKDGARSRAMDPPGDWGAEYHTCGQWMLANPDKWWVLDNVDGTANFPIRAHMIGFVSHDLNDVRLLCCGDNSGVGYDTGGQMHPTLSPDGKLLMWTSNMAGSGGFQIFVVKTPVS
jgi:hypothetical protein